MTVWFSFYFIDEEIEAQIMHRKSQSIGAQQIVAIQRTGEGMVY